MSHHLFRVGKVWHYRFQINGVRVQRSTRETVKHLAESIANRAYRDTKMWARGAEPVPSLRDLVAQWLAAHQSIVSPHYIRLVETFGRLHLYELGDIEIDELTTPLVEAALLEHRRMHAPATCNHWLNMLKAVCRWALRRGVIPAIPWQMKLLKVQRSPRVTLPVPAAMDWLSAVDDYAGDRQALSLAVRLMFGLGLRESEVLSSRWSWVDWSRRTYTPGITKGREADPVPIPTWLLDYLSPMRQATGLMVCNSNGNAFPPGFVRRAMRAANAACQIEGLTPHRLRSTFATLLSEQGLPVQTVQRLLRHKSPLTTMRYLEANLSAAVDAQESIAQLAGLQPQQKHGGEEVANSTGQSHAE
ncbi:tyrosine-type recombinase/integrase [Paraburkholderia nemoris]|uniref:tyrosine-type recombinase/integrase n=1 Tax=Paraburkholderia nemoris TaxID=2793076 RepID=UPI0038BC39FF